MGREPLREQRVFQLSLFIPYEFRSILLKRRAYRERAFCRVFVSHSRGASPPCSGISPNTIRRGKPKVRLLNLELTLRPGGLWLVAEEAARVCRSRADHLDL